MLHKAVEWDMLEHDLFNKGARLMLKENNHRLRFLTDSEVEALLKACDDLKTLHPPLASHLVMKGIGLKAVQKLLGYTDLTMRYAHLSKGHLQEAVAALNSLRNVGTRKADSKLTVGVQK
jgi:integrase